MSQFLRITPQKRFEALTDDEHHIDMDALTALTDEEAVLIARAQKCVIVHGLGYRRTSRGWEGPARDRHTLLHLAELDTHSEYQLRLAHNDFIARMNEHTVKGLG